MSYRPLVFAHRGASHQAPENTLAAFVLAQELGADGVELDVRRTSDGVLVVHHDPQLEEYGVLADHSFEELRTAHPEIPTFAEALDTCSEILVNIEMKCLPWEPDSDVEHRYVVHAVADTLRARAQDSIVSSFDLGAVNACHAYAPEMTTGWLTSGIDVSEGAAKVSGCGHKWLNPDRISALRISPEEIEELHDRGVRLNVWTVDEPDEIRALATLGVDAIVTNEPDVALDVLGA